MALFIAELIWVAIRIALIFIRIPFVGCGLSMISCVVWIGFLALSIYCIVQAVGGKRFRIPLITDMAETKQAVPAGGGYGGDMDY